MRVEHRIWGIGEIIEEWGTFYACRSCHAQCLPRRLSQCCNDRSIEVSGTGVFDILFEDGKVRSINQQWFRRVL